MGRPLDFVIIKDNITFWIQMKRLYDEFFIIVKKLIHKIVFAENETRVIEKHPLLWSQWFYSNAHILWDANWLQNSEIRRRHSLTGDYR